MTIKEFKQLTEEISSHYLNFKLEEYQKKYWYDGLKKYDLEDVRDNFKLHLKGEFSYKEPTLNWLVHHLRTPEQKELAKKGWTTCRKCGQEFSVDELDKWERCERKCSIYNYIERKSQQFGINIAEIMGEDIYKIGLGELDKRYDRFLLEVVRQEQKQQKLTQDEKEALRNMIKKGVINWQN